MKKTPRALKSSLFGVAMLLTLTSITTTRAQVSAQQALENATKDLMPFFTDPNHKISKPFSTMMQEVVMHLEEADDAELKELAKALKTICNETNLATILQVLKKHTQTIEKIIKKNLSVQKKPLSIAILMKRIQAALALR